MLFVLPVCPAASYLYLSSLGTGTYLGNADDSTDEQVLTALLYAVTRGWNVIDTGKVHVTVAAALAGSWP
jgi:aryl-alcohol dehydrogenase-like predicted oxidoreductase